LITYSNVLKRTSNEALPKLSEAQKKLNYIADVAVQGKANKWVVSTKDNVYEGNYDAMRVVKWMSTDLTPALTA